MICDNCDRGRHRRCTGCPCVLCPIVRRGGAQLPSEQSPPRRRYSYVSNGRPHGPTPGTSSLPDSVQASIRDGLRHGDSISALARAHSTTRDKVRTIRKQLP